MLRTGIGILLCCVQSFPLLADSLDEPISALLAVPKGNDNSDAFQLAIYGVDRPLRLQMTCFAGGKPWAEYFQDVHTQYVKSLCAYLDADGNGSLSPREATRLSAPKSRSKEALGGEVFVAFNFRVLDVDGDGAASFAEVESYLASLGETALRVTAVSAESWGDLLFREIDVDGDRIVTPLEASQVDRLRERDRDGNHVITQEELRGRVIGPTPPEFVAAVSGDRESSGPLRVQEAGALPLPAGIDVRIEFSEHGSIHTAPKMTVTLTTETASAGWSVETNTAGEHVLKHGRRLLVLRLLAPATSAWPNERQDLLKEFATLTNADGSSGRLAASMEMTPALKAWFTLADLNGDDAVDESELTNCLDRMGLAQSAAKAGQLRAVVFSEQAGLWPLVDLNRDGRLSRRELQAIPGIVERLAREGGTLSAGNIPQTTLIVLQRGPFSATDAKNVLHHGGPVWFNRADRNADGDLDRDEFPGTPEDFQKVDLNRDGWIDLGEASQIPVTASETSEHPPADALLETKP